MLNKSVPTARVESGTPPRVEDWGSYHGILDRAREAMGVRYVSLARHEPGTGLVEVVGMAGWRSQAFLRGLAVIRRRFPNFTVAGITFHSGVNEFSRMSYQQGYTVAAPVERLAAGIVHPLIVSIAFRLGGLRYGLVCPIKIDGQVCGAIVFHRNKLFTEQDLTSYDAFVHQGVLTWEDGRLAQVLLRQARSTSAAEPLPGDGTVKPGEQPMQYADLVLYPRTRQVFRGIVELDLTPLEYELMACFLRQPEKTLSRDDLTRQVWGGPNAVQTEAVDATVMHLRRKLELRGHARIIHPVRGQGYVLR